MQVWVPKGVRGSVCIPEHSRVPGTAGSGLRAGVPPGQLGPQGTAGPALPTRSVFQEENAVLCLRSQEKGAGWKPVVGSGHKGGSQEFRPSAPASPSGDLFPRDPPLPRVSALLHEPWWDKPSAFCIPMRK